MPGEYRRDTKPTGLDWSTLTPTCTSCARRDSTVHCETHICATCAAPTPAKPPKKPKSVRKPRRRPRQRPTQHTTPKPPRIPKPPKPKGQYAKPIGPRRQPATRNHIDDRQVINAYRDGTTAPKIAAQWGTTPKRIRTILARAGIELRDDRALHSGGRPRIYPPETRAEVARLYLSGLSRSQVADQLGIPYKTVVTIMTRDGVPARQRQAGRQDGAAALKQRIRGLGTTPAQINAWARANGHPASRGIPSTTVVDAYEHATRRERVA